jgi:hypothetical protein
MGGTDKMVFNQRELALGESAKVGEQVFADEPAEDGITKELETFVIRRRSGGLGLRFIRPRAVGDGSRQQRLVAE